MFVRVGLAPVPRKCVSVLMVGLVSVAVSVDELVMSVLMLVSFGEMQPDTRCHQHSGDPKGC